MIDDGDPSTSTLHLLIWQALKSYATDSLLFLLEDADAIVRTAAAREVQVRGDRSALEYALRHCSDSRDEIREISAFVLGQLGTPTYPFRSESLPKLSELVGDSSPSVRSAAVAALGHLEAKEKEELLIEAARDPDSDVRANAAVALGRLGRPSQAASEALRKLLKDSTAEVRRWATLGMELARSSDLKSADSTRAQ